MSNNLICYVWVFRLFNFVCFIIYNFYFFLQCFPSNLLSKWRLSTFLINEYVCMYVWHHDMYVRFRDYYLLLSFISALSWCFFNVHFPHFFFEITFCITVTQPFYLPSRVSHDSVTVSHHDREVVNGEWDCVVSVANEAPPGQMHRSSSSVDLSLKAAQRLLLRVCRLTVI